MNRILDALSERSDGVFFSSFLCARLLNWAGRCCGDFFSFVDGDLKKRTDELPTMKLIAIMMLCASTASLLPSKQTILMMAGTQLMQQKVGDLVDPMLQTLRKRIEQELSK